MVDAAGAEVGHVIYDAYGQVVENTLPEGLTDRLFTGQIYDATIGLYFYNARYYDPLVGQFTQPDSIIPDPLNPIAWNRFNYVYGNPTNLTDPSGHCAGLCITAIGVGLFALGGFGGHLAATSAGYEVGDPQWYAAVGLGGTFSVLSAGIGYYGFGGWALAASIAGDTFIDTAILGGPFWPSLARNATFNVAFDVAGYAVGRALQLRNLEFVGYHGTSSVHESSILKRIDPPPPGLNFRGYSQLGEGFYVTPDLDAAKWSAQKAVGKSGGKPVVLKIYTKRNLDRMTSANVSRSLWGLKPFPTKYITDYDYLVAPISNLEPWSQIKFNPRAYSLLKATK